MQVQRPWLDAALRAEDLGFDTFQLTDHLDATPMAPIPLLGGLAVATTRIGLGTLVLDNDFRNPAVLSIASPVSPGARRAVRRTGVGRSASLARTTDPGAHVGSPDAQ